MPTATTVSLVALVVAPLRASAPPTSSFDGSSDVILDAAHAVDEHAPWAAASTLLRGCVVDEWPPLTVTLEYAHRNDGLRMAQAYRPWRTSGWRVRDDAEVAEVADEIAPCGVDAHVTREGRAHHIAVVARRAWRAYATHARGDDTLAPLTRAGVRDFGGMATTAVGALDTMWLMGLRDEFEEACAIVNASRVLGDPGAKVDVFETTIRVVGGLLAAYELSGRAWLLERAVALGTHLLPAFGAHGVPQSDVELARGRASDPPWGSTSLSEAALTLEFRHLSAASGDARFAAAVEHADARLRDAVSARGGDPLVPALLEGDVLKLGARTTDSYYESLLKEWVRSGDERHGAGFVAAARAIRERLFVAVDEQLFVGERHAGKLVPQMDHLVCFWPGALALAVRHELLPPDPHLHDAQRIAHACRRMHAPPHGLAPEITSVRLSDNTTRAAPGAAHNLLRPETLESLYVLWCVSGDETYREWSWTVFDALERASRVDGGYAAVQDVARPELAHRDAMPSHFIAETLKYAWLTAVGTDDVTRTHVFNTEAHLVPRIGHGRRAGRGVA